MLQIEKKKIFTRIYKAIRFFQLYFDSILLFDVGDLAYEKGKANIMYV